MYMYKLVSTLAPSFYWFFFILAGTRTTIKARMSLNFSQIRLLTAKLTALERLEKSLQTYNGRNVVTTVVPLFLNVSSLFLQGTRTTKKALMFLNFCQIQQLTTELAALECI